MPGLTINNRLHSDLINAMNNALKLDCMKYGFLVSLNKNYFLSKPFIQ